MLDKKLGAITGYITATLHLKNCIGIEHILLDSAAEQSEARGQLCNLELSVRPPELYDGQEGAI